MSPQELEAKTWREFSLGLINLAEVLKVLPYNQQDLAAMWGCSQPTISRVKLNPKEPSCQAFLKRARVWAAARAKYPDAEAKAVQQVALHEIEIWKIHAAAEVRLGMLKHLLQETVDHLIGLEVDDGLQKQLDDIRNSEAWLQLQAWGKEQT